MANEDPPAVRPDPVWLDPIVVGLACAVVIYVGTLVHVMQRPPGQGNHHSPADGTAWAQMMWMMMGWVPSLVIGGAGAAVGSFAERWFGRTWWLAVITAGTCAAIVGAWLAR